MLGSGEQKLRLNGGNNLGLEAKLEGKRQTWVDEEGEADVRSRVIVGNKFEAVFGKKACFALD